METVLTGTIYVNLSLLLLHEMDAVRRREWNMMFAVNRLAEEKAYIVFSVLHFPMYVMMFYLARGLDSAWSSAIMWALAVFFVLHGVIHTLFRSHMANEFKGMYSNSIIYLMSAIALAQIAMLTSTRV